MSRNYAPKDRYAYTTERRMGSSSGQSFGDLHQTKLRRADFSRLANVTVSLAGLQLMRGSITTLVFCITVVEDLDFG
jgi:hypothetical protein